VEFSGPVNLTDRTNAALMVQQMDWTITTGGF